MKIFGFLSSSALLCALILVPGLVFAASADAGPAPPSSSDQAVKGSDSPGGLPGRLATDLSAAAARVAPLLERYGYPLLFAAILVVFAILLKGKIAATGSPTQLTAAGSGLVKVSVSSENHILAQDGTDFPAVAQRIIKVEDVLAGRSS